MAYDLGVDLGGTTIVAAVVRHDGSRRTRPEVVATFPAVAHRGEHGAIRTGDEAVAMAASSPGSVVRDVIERVGDAVPPVVSGEPWPAADAAAELVLAAVRRVAALEGGAATELVISRPATWGEHREGALRAALVRVGLGHAVLLDHVETAVHALRGVRPGETVAVVDLSARALHAAVVRRVRPRGATPRGDDRLRLGERLADSGTPVALGGVDVDDAVLAHVREEVGALPADRAAAEALRRACVAAKETLSRETEAVVAVADPGTRVRLTRGDLEGRIAPLVARTVDVVTATVGAAGTAPDHVVLVGGSTRIPCVARGVAEALGRAVPDGTDPGVVLAHGAARAAGRRSLATAPAGGAVGSGTATVTLVPTTRSAGPVTPEAAPAGTATAVLGTATDLCPGRPGDVARPPVVTAPVPPGLAPDPHRRTRHRRAALVAAGVLVLGGVGAATIPVPGLTAPGHAAATDAAPAARIAQALAAPPAAPPPAAPLASAAVAATPTSAPAPATAPTTTAAPASRATPATAARRSRSAPPSTSEADAATDEATDGATDTAPTSTASSDDGTDDQ